MAKKNSQQPPATDAADQPPATIESGSNPPPSATPPAEPAPTPDKASKRVTDFDALVAAKMKAGLPRADAEEVARRQIEEDKAQKR